jgi:thioredoxin reductase (NADPH)
MLEPSKIYDIAIIGGGPGGYTAALYSARAGFSTVVLEKMSPGGQMATTDQVDNYPGFPDGVNGYELGVKMQEGAERFGAVTSYTEVLSVDLMQSPKTIETAEGAIQAHTVILSTGASPRELGLKEERSLRGKGVSYCATCDGMFYRGKTVVIVGGGNTAAADALYLSKICKKVYVIHRRDTLRASAVYRTPLFQRENISFVWDSQVTGILQDQTVTGVTVQNKKTGETQEIACDGIFVAIGNVPNSGLFKGQVELDGSGYVAANESTKTNIPGVFAVGDVRQKPLRQIITAAADGAVAAQCAEEYLNTLQQE